MVGRIYRGIGYLIYYILNFNKFGYLGFPPRIIKPLQIDGKKNIFISKNTIIAEGSWIAAMPINDEVKSRLVIGKGCRLGHFNHIYASKSIVIEDSVLTADRVYISDNLHEYEDINKPILEQPIKQCSEVVIGEGSWIGENVCIIGASVGKHCVIGANSVVTKSIPDYSVAVGSPARVIKKYCTQSKAWIKIQTNE